MRSVMSNGPELAVTWLARPTSSARRGNMPKHVEETCLSTSRKNAGETGPAGLLARRGGERDALTQVGERHRAEHPVDDLVPGVEEERLRQRADAVGGRGGARRVPAHRIADAV